MAQLKDLLVNGVARFISDVFTNKIQITSLSAPTASGGTTYGAGTSGQALMTNGTSIYWGTIPAPDLSSKVSKTGDTMTGQLVVPYNSTNTAGGIKFNNVSGYDPVVVAAVDGYRDTTYDEYIPRLSLFYGNGKTSLLGHIRNPIADGDAANKSYVDTKFSAVLPSVSSSDNGKVLMVVNGIWTKANLPTYNGGVS